MSALNCLTRRDMAHAIHGLERLIDDARCLDGEPEHPQMGQLEDALQRMKAARWEAQA